jgi:hypothetical protein
MPAAGRLGFCLALCVVPLSAATAPVISPTTLPNGILGSGYSQTLTASAGYGAGTYSFSLLAGAGSPPTGLAVSAAGVVSGTPTATGTFTFTVVVTSTFVSPVEYFPPLTGSQTYTVVIYPNIVFTLDSAASGVVGVSYSQTFTATGAGGASTYTWSLSDSAPPPGLTFSSAGVLSGIPTAAGTYGFTVQLSSLVPGLGAVTAYSSYTVTVIPALVITGSLGGGTVGVAYSAALGATGGYGAGTYAFSIASGTLPSGLSLAAGGTLSGTPTVAGTSTFTVQVTSTQVVTSELRARVFSAAIPAAVGAPSIAATQSFTVTIYPSLAIALASVSAGTVGISYSQTYTATGGGGASTYTWSVVAGKLPTGLTFSAAGVLSGIPTTVGSFSFTLQVSSAVPTVGVQTAIQPFNIAIASTPALTITGAAGGGLVGVSYSATLGATGGYGTGTYTFSITSGAPPAGITLSTSGTLSGTPTAAGTSTFTVQVASAAAGFPPLSATQSFTVTIYPSLAITLATASSGTVNVAYSQTYTATGGGGASTYTWAVATGTLPTGLTFSAAGVLSGTPTAVGSFAFTVQVSSAVPTVGLQTANQAFSIAIASAPAIAITGAPGGGAVGVAYSATLGATGGYGTGTYTFSITSGAPPAGITLSAGGTLSGTPTAAGSSTFTVQVTSASAGVPPLTGLQAFTIVVVPAAPNITISGLPATATPATQPILGVSVGNAYPAAIQGEIALTFAPTSGPDDPNVQFSTGGRTATFQVPAGSTQAQFTGNAPGVQTGTVAGTITLTLTLTAAGVNVTPKPAPTTVITVAASPPTITSATFAPVSGGFNLLIVGFSTPRDMASAAIAFTPAAGVTLAGASTTVSLSQVFTTWYGSSTSAAYGSIFLLTIPFTENGANPLASLSVVLTNSQGNSAPAAVTF